MTARTRRLLGSLALACAALSAAPLLSASTLPLSGRLGDVQGQSLSGTYRVTFRLYDAPTGGTPVYTETRDLRLRQGAFSTSLGETTTLPTDRDWYASVQVAGVGAYNELSDGRYKANVQTLPNALDSVLQLRGVTYDWNASARSAWNVPEGKQVGLIAQDVEAVLPQAVSHNADGIRSVAYTKVVPVLIEAIKAQQAEIAALQERLSRLEKPANGAQTP